MTISIRVTAPDGARAKLSRSDGVGYIVEPGQTGTFTIDNTASTMIISEEEIEDDDGDGSANAADSGGGGHGDPDPDGG